MCIHVSFVFGSRTCGTLSLWCNIVLNHVEYILFKLSGLRSLIWQKSRLFMTTRERKKDNEIEDGNRMWDREQMKGRKSDGRHELEDLNRVIWFKSEFPFSFHSNSFKLFFPLILLPLSLFLSSSPSLSTPRTRCNVLEQRENKSSCNRAEGETFDGVTKWSGEWGWERRKEVKNLNGMYLVLHFIQMACLFKGRDKNQ